MTIGDRIFERLSEIGITQKEFSEKTGISQRRSANGRARGQNELPWYVIDRSAELGTLVTRYRELDEKQRARVMGYLEALRVLDENA